MTRGRLYFMTSGCIVLWQDFSSFSLLVYHRSTLNLSIIVKCCILTLVPPRFQYRTPPSSC